VIINDKAKYVTASGETVDYSHEIRLTDPHRHKWGSAMAEYLDHLDGEDEWTGSTEWTEYVQRFGKWLLSSDDRGFVSAVKYATVDAARARFNEINEAYSAWVEAEDEDEDIPAVPADFDVRPLADDEHPAGRTTCGTCGLSWDDEVSTTRTPVPAGRCPFEDFHA
jgi:hypothetical protein